MIRSGRRCLLLVVLAGLLTACRGSAATFASTTAAQPPTVTTTPTVAAAVQPAALPPKVSTIGTASIIGDGADLPNRPLRLPALAPGAPCPVTSWQPASNVDPAGGFSFPDLYNAFGQGPIYPIIYNFDIKRGPSPSPNWPQADPLVGRTRCFGSPARPTRERP